MPFNITMKIIRCVAEIIRANISIRDQSIHLTTQGIIPWRSNDPQSSPLEHNLVLLNRLLGDVSIDVGRDPQHRLIVEPIPT